MGANSSVALIVLCLSLMVPEAMAARSVAQATKRPSGSRYEWKNGYSFWQESLKITKGSSSAQAQMQSEGVFSGLSWSRGLFGKRVYYTYGFEAGLGTIKGATPTGNAIQDSFKNQLWYVLGLTPGLGYRTTSVSEIGLYLPVWYRGIQWKLQSGSTTNPDRDASVSVGLSGVFIHRLEKGRSLHASVTHHQMWGATVWNLSYVVSLK